MTAEILTADSILDRVRQDGVRRTANALRKPPVPSRLLQELAAREDTTIGQQFVAAYPLSPSHLLESLAQTAQDPEVFPFLATNPRTPPQLLGEFAAHENPEVRAHVATHPQLAARELLTLAKDADLAVRRAVATNPALRLPHHATLARDGHPSVRLRLVTHAALPPQAALALAGDTSPIVRTHAVASATVTEETLLGWASSDEEDIQLALVTRVELPSAALRLLMLSPSPRVRRLARERIEPQPVELVHLLNQGNAEERIWMAGLTSLPAPLQRSLAQDETPGVCAALAKNPSLVSDIAEYFIAHADDEVCTGLATNPAITADHVQTLAATRKPAILTALAYRETLDQELVSFLLIHSSDFLRHWAIQQRSAAVSDPAGARKLTSHALPSVRALGVASHAWRRADLYDFYRDPAQVVRIATLRHAHVADELIADAMTDSSPDIRTVAQAVQAARVLSARTAPQPREVNPVKTQVTSFAPALEGHAAGAAPSPGLFNQLKRLFWQ